MARKLVIWLVLVPLAILLVMFAIANREMVTVSFDPFSSAQPAAAVTLPLFVLIFILVLIGVFVGGVAAWLRQSHHRRTARVLQGDVAGLRREVALLNERLSSAPMQESASDGAARIGYHPAQN